MPVCFRPRPWSWLWLSTRFFSEKLGPVISPHDSRFRPHLLPATLPLGHFGRVGSDGHRGLSPKVVPRSTALGRRLWSEGKQMTTSQRQTGNAQSGSGQNGNWKTSPRWRGITRPYTQADVDRLRGSLQIEHTLARRGAEILWNLLN